MSIPLSMKAPAIVHSVGVDEARGPAAGNARKVTEAMRERGILLSATGPAGNVLKIRPLARPIRRKR